MIQLWLQKERKLNNKMANEIANVKTNGVVISKGQQFQIELMNELDKTMSEMNTQFSEYGKQCVINAITGLITTCQNANIPITQLNPIILKAKLQNIGFTELNYASIPSELYIDIRKNKVKTKDKNGEENEKEIYSVDIKPQGAGNEKLVRRFGVGLKKGGLRQAWIVREGDEFTLPQYNGTEITPPTWKPKSLDGKVLYVVYVAEKVDGTTEYLIASREGVKPNIVAQIRQNTLYAFKPEGQKYGVDEAKRDAFYEQLNDDAEELTVDELIKKYKDKINPTYTSGGSKEQMILRKMKNNALKYYPKEYDNSYIKQAVENMFEDKDESLNTKKEDVVEKVEKELAEMPNVEDAVQDFNVDENGVVDVDSVNKEEKSSQVAPSVNDDDDPF